MRKKTLLLLLGIVAIILAACSEGDSSSDGTSSGDGTVELSVWLTPQWQGVFDTSEEKADYDSFMNYAAEKFVEQYDKEDVKINVEVIAGDQRDEMLNVNLNGGTPPDIFFESTFAMGDYVHRGALVPITDIIDDEAKADIDQSLWDEVTFGDDVYFYPFTNNPGTLVYNADMLRDAGLEEYIGEADQLKTWTMDELETILEELKENTPTDKYSNAYPMGLFALNNQGDTWNLAYLRMFGNAFFNDEGNLIIDDENGAKAAAWMKKIYDNEWVNPGAESVSSNDVNAMFQNQQLGVSFTNSILYNNLQADMESGNIEEFDARLANIPSESGDPLSFTYVTGSAIFDTGDEKRMEVSKDFVKFLSSDSELVKASQNGVPVRASVAEELSDENPLFTAYEENAAYIFSFTGNVPGYNELRQVLYPELQAMYTGGKSPEEAIQSYQEKGNSVIDSAKQDSVIYNN
ncbi:ABC transporter substrate-binding protein [Oceanobacillus sp. FSL H7-0719]|uniref:ABC transporter substrate-binding protein n=1 Tax=Oceanobacillus sp. FSL H7-0719 TaxID=2954507 RepID=UPI00325594A0